MKWIIAPTQAAGDRVRRLHGLQRDECRMISTEVSARGARMQEVDVIYVEPERIPSGLLRVVRYNILKCGAAPVAR